MAQERAGLDDYRQQVQTIYEYEVENNIPENDRMTHWYDEMNIPVAKPWYKENDPSVMDRAVGDRRIPISESDISARYAEILREMQEIILNTEREKGQITLHIKYAEPIEFNGFHVENDTITFDNLESVKAYANGEVTYNSLDDSVRKKDNEILLYAENERGEVVWGTKEEQEIYHGENEEITIDTDNERARKLAEDINVFLSEYSDEYLSSENEVYQSVIDGDLYEYAEQLDEIRSQAFEGYNDKLLLTQLDDDTREMVERLDLIRKDMVLWELDHDRLIHEDMYNPKEVAIALKRDFGFTEENIQGELSRREYNRVDAENQIDLVSESDVLYDYSDRILNEVLSEMQRIERNNNTLEVGEITPIREFVDDNGYIYDGQSISYFQAMQENRINEHGFFYGDRSYVYNAVRDFENENNIENRAIEEDGSYLDKDILYSAYDEYVGMSHFAEMQAKYGEYVRPLAEANATHAQRQNEEHGYAMSTDPNRYASTLYAEFYYAEKNGFTPEQIKILTDYMNVGDSPYTSSRAENMKHANALLRGGKSEEFINELATKDYSTRDLIVHSLQYTKTPEQENILAKANSMESAHGITSFFIEVNRNVALDPNRENEKAEVIMEYANQFSERDEGKPFAQKWDSYATEMLGDFALGTGNTDGYTLTAEEIKFIGDKMLSEDKFFNPEEVKALVTEERNRIMAEQQKSQENNSHRENKENTAGRDKMSKETQDRQKRVNELRNMVVQGVEAVRSDENYKAWLRTRSHNFMNKYSFGNILRVAFQNPTASTVMGYEQWKDYGRQVNAGAKGMQILVPMFYQEKTSGNLCRDIMASLTNQLKTKESAEYKLGETGLRFTMNRGSSEIGLSLPNGASITFANRQELNTFLQKNVIGKTPRYYNPQSVFDVADTSTPNLLSVKRGFKDSELIRGKGVDVPIETENGLVLAKAKFSKDPNAPKGYEWVDKNKIGKGTWDLVTAPQGEPVKVGRKNEEFLIMNTDERKAKFHDVLEMNVIAKNPEVMKTLFEAIKELSEDKGVPVKVVSKDSDDWQTSKEANGYFHRAEGVEKANYPKGFIVIPTELLQENPAHAVKTLVHEMAHADLHGEVAKLEKEMGMSVSREMKETQAESVAFMVCENFGIDSSDYSFKYLATWASDEELKAFTKSLNVIDREAQQLVSEINAKLETLGLDKELRELPKEALSKETIDTRVSLYNKEISDNRDLIIMQNDELTVTAENSSDNSDKADIVILMKDNLEKRQHEVELQRDLIDSLECADTREMQDEIMAELDTSLSRSSNLSKTFDDYKTSLETISLRNREGLREQFAQNPLSTLGKMSKDSYPELATLSVAQKQYIAKSPYVRESLTSLLATDPHKFVSEVVTRANDAMKVASKSGMFVEVISCKQTTEPPILKNGDLAHPRVADKIVGEAEMQIRDIKRNSDFFPNADTRLGIYSFTEKGNISCYVANLRIGDSTQVNLMDYLKKACPNKGELINAFESAIKERGAKGKLISVGDISHGDNERGIVDAKERMTMEQVEAEIKERKEAGARERAESGKDNVNETQSKSAKSKDERGE